MKVKVFDLWLACSTQEATAEAVGIAQPTVIEWSKRFIESLTAKQSIKFNFQDDYQIPLFIIFIPCSTTIKTLSAAISALPLKTRLCK